MVFCGESNPTAHKYPRGRGMVGRFRFCFVMKKITKEQAQKLFAKKNKYNYLFLPKYDGRKKEFKNISREEWRIIVAKCRKREELKAQVNTVNKLEMLKQILVFFAEIPYIYNGDGLDDFNKYQRPSRNGRGWVAICPGEPYNNYYTEDPTAVAILKKRYENFKNTVK
jgi:hypothetical protein